MAGNETTPEKLSGQLGSSPSPDQNVTTLQPPRENMIETAVRFLQSPQVRQTPLERKRVFLDKKGLTTQEIKMAIERSGTKNDVAPQPSTVLTTSAQQPLPPQQGLQMQQQMVPYSQPVPVRVTTWRDYAAIAVIVSGVSYGVYKLVQNFLIPYLQSRREERERLERLEASIQELNKSILHTVQDVECAVTSIRTLLEQQQAKIDSLTAATTTGRAITSHGRTAEIGEVKAEITSLKGLLLNRHQFPATPQPAPIPAWQRATTVGIPVTGMGAAGTELVAAPTETGAAPTETGAAPTETGAAPTETGVAPTEMGVAPTKVGGAPTKVGVAPTKVGVPPTKVGVPPTEFTAVPTKPDKVSTEMGQANEDYSHRDGLANGDVQSETMKTAEAVATDMNMHEADGSFQREVAMPTWDNE